MAKLLSANALVESLYPLVHIFDAGAPAIPNLKFFATDLHRLSRIFKTKSAPIREISGWVCNWVVFCSRFGIAAGEQLAGV
jgi:hypothetical protein